MARRSMAMLMLDHGRSSGAIRRDREKHRDSVVSLLGSPFELPDCALGERRVAVQIVRIEDRVHIAKAVPRDGGDLCLGASRNREPRHRSTA